MTRSARVVVDPQGAHRVARRTVRAVAAWSRALAIATLHADAGEIAEPVRQATRSHAFEQERMGFRDGLRQAAAAGIGVCGRSRRPASDAIRKATALLGREPIVGLVRNAQREILQC